MERNISDIFIDRIYETAAAAPDPVMETEARRCLLDFLGGAVGGTSVLKDRALSYLASQPECAGVTVIHTGKKASLQNAALLNGMLAHVFDIDDGNRLTSTHPGSPVIAAVLSLAEWKDLDLNDVFRGILVGYEATNRLGKCLQPYHRKRGFHATGTCGTIGAALGAAAALGYSREEMKTVLSAACTSAAGILEMQENRSTLKPLNVGRAAQDAVTCALLAKCGFQGPDDPLLGKFGFLKAVADDMKPEFLTGDIPQNLTVLGTYHKVHASCRHTHAAVDAARKIFADHPERKPAEIRHIQVRMYEQGVKGHDHTVAESPVAGKMSIPFAMALAIVKGRVGFSDFTDENIFDPEVQRIMKASEVLVDDALTAQAPGIREAIVRIDFADGTSLTESVKFPKGEPEYPLTEADLRAKFSDLSACGNLDREAAQKLADLVLQGSPETKVRALTQLL